MLSHPTIAVTLSPEVDLIWRKCHKLGNEMSVGTIARRIFPTLEYNITGLDPDSFYRISLHLDSNDNKKVSVKGSRKIWHWKELQTGKEWMKKKFSFDSVRIINKKLPEDDGSDVIYCPSGYWYSPVMTIYKDDLPIHTSCILHTVFKAVTYFHSKELRDYKSTRSKYARNGFIRKRDADQRMPFSVEEPRSPAQGTSTASENCFTAQSMSSTLSYSPISEVTTPLIPPTINPIFFNMLPVYQNLNLLFNPFCNPMGNLLTNVFHSPSITPPTNSTTPADKATDDDEEEEINVTDL
ncbi:hypothetical protein CAEBREN_13582 [Caenorhabditis brenneri]|uniref:T-box domain-containing protein n=1 Tax=Caenorhabditis brenneri TaxID=135651 RepID=G0PLC9_CAEBE|nr:hypothetical protein CAEBREN_13582 [Caenorhabditis brenneri]